MFGDLNIGKILISMYILLPNKCHGIFFFEFKGTTAPFGLVTINVRIKKGLIFKSKLLWHGFWYLHMDVWNTIEIRF